MVTPLASQRCLNATIGASTAFLEPDELQLAIEAALRKRRDLLDVQTAALPSLNSKNEKGPHKGTL